MRFLGRVAAGAVIGAHVGMVELLLWPTVRHLSAGVAAGAVFGALIAAAITGKSALHIWVGAAAGIVAGSVWWLVAASATPLPVPMVIGGVLGAVFVHFG
ncbi:MAG TPA: hypothetical protein VF618_03265 [Thermoanaerobaculia bacterium]